MSNPPGRQINAKTGSYGTGTGYSLVPGQRDLFIFDSLVLNDRSQHDLYHVNNIVGFDDADVIVSEDPNPDAIGSNPNPGRPGGRTIVLGGRIIAGNWDRLDDMEYNLRTAFRNDDELPLTISRPGRTFVRNFATDPSFEGNDLSLWVTGSFYGVNPGGVKSQQPSGPTGFGNKVMLFAAPAGTANIGIIHPLAPTDGFKAGTPYTFSIYVHGGGGGETGQIFLGQNGPDSAMSSVLVAPASGYNRYSVTWTPLTDTPNGVCGYRSTSSGGQSVYLDAAMVNQGTTPNTYFDGSMPGYRWLGDPNNSESSSALADVYVLCRKSEKLNISKELKNERYERDFQISLRATDPRMVSSVSNKRGIVPVSISALGRTYSRSYDLKYNTNMNSLGTAVSSGNIVSVFNSGNENAQPIFTLTGTLVGPMIITNETTGESMRLNASVNPGDYIVIDIKNGTILYSNGANMFSAYDKTSDWVTIAPGYNQFSISIQGFSGNSRFDIEWNDTWM